MSCQPYGGHDETGNLPSDMLAELPLPLIVSRWFHLGAVIVAIGGTVFLRLVMQPMAGKILGGPQHDALRDALNPKWARVLQVCIAIILLTGFYNAYSMLAVHKGQPMYHSLLGLKILLALTLFFVALAVTGRNPAFERLRRNRAIWMLFNIVLAGVIVALSNVLKFIPQSG